MPDAEWSCAEVPEWQKEKCCPYCHGKGEQSFRFQIRGMVKQLCCKYSLAFIQFHSKEEIIILDEDLLLTTRP